MSSENWYAINNQDNKELSEADRGAIKLFIQSNNISKEDEKILKDFSNKYTEKDLENNPELVKTYVEAYNRYNRVDLEVDADNVGLALQSYMGGSKNRQIKNYTRDFLVNEKLAQATSNDKTLGAIRAFIWRKESNHFGYGRLTDKVNTRTFYQSANQNNILFQSAYHGTPHRFDEFSLDAIGTGEGAQAHGWGLYFAGDNRHSGYRSEDEFDKHSDYMKYYKESNMGFSTK